MTENNELISHYKNLRRLVLSAEEFWYLLNLYAPTSVIGIENPYTGRLVEDIETSEQIALNELLSNNILHLVDGKTLEFTDTAVQSMLETCLRPDHCLWLTVAGGTIKKSVLQRWVYFSEGQIVDIAHEGEHSYWLTDVRDTAEPADYLTGFLSQDNEEAVASIEIVLEQTSFDAALKAIDAGDEAAGKNILTSAVLNNTSIEELVSALGGEGRSIVAVNFSNPSQPELCHMQELGYLAGRSGGWLMKQYEQDGTGYVRFQPGKAAEFRELLFSMVQ